MSQISPSQLHFVHLETHVKHHVSYGRASGPKNNENGPSVLYPTARGVGARGPCCEALAVNAGHAKRPRAMVMWPVENSRLAAGSTLEKSRESCHVPIILVNLYHLYPGWWLGHPSEKYERQLG